MSAEPFNTPAETAWQNDWIWWKRGVIYQVYPRSFQDSNGDGCGDLPGILRRLDYLEWLGVDAVWISPFYPSPMKDFGYDVSDYTAVHPVFGTMRDFDELLAEAHKHGLRIILDLVPNHTSDQHPWFRESAGSRRNARRDWYIWSDPVPGGGPPNNWLSEFGGSAWQWHEPTQQYYYHAFLSEQPDLNWRNPEVRKAIHDVMRFWLDKGVDGFRVDVMWHLIKDAHLRNNPPNPDYDPRRDSPYNALIPVFSADQPEVHDVVREMRRVIDEYDARVLIGEIYLPIQELVTYYGNEQSEAHLPFNFQLISTHWDAAHIRRAVDIYEASLQPDDWPNWVLGNHDKPRLAGRVGRAQARVAAVLLLTLRGTPTVYNGEELGMKDVDISPEQAVDPRERNVPGKGLGRDPQRTPMQWDTTANAGFTGAGNTPWLPVAPDFRTCNVASERQDHNSLLSLYQCLMRLRRNEAALAVGDYEPLAAPEPLFAYLRRHGSTAFLIVLNFSDTAQTYRTTPGYDRGEVLISTHAVFGAERKLAETLELQPNEGLVIRLHAPAPAHPASNIGGGGTHDITEDNP